MGKPFVLAGPWKGIEEREALQGDDHAEIALNVDLSRGYLEGRSGFGAINTTGSKGAQRKLHLLKKGGKPYRILGVGVGAQADDERGHLIMSLFDLDGTLIASDNIHNTDQSENSSVARDFNCSFLDAFLAFDDNGSGVKDQARPITIVVTERGSFIYDERHAHTLRVVDPANDAVRLNNVNYGYWTHSPACKIAIEHKTYYCYAGFAEGYKGKLHVAIEELQTKIPETMVEQDGRGAILLGPQFLVLSDPSDPLGIIEYRAFQVDQGEYITGLASYMEQIIVFSDKAIYSITGGTDETFQMFKVVKGVGCIAKDSIVEFGGLLYFMSNDGFYAFQGMSPQGGIVNISDGIGSLFGKKKKGTRIPAAIAPYMHKIRWPFQADLGQCSRTQAMHVQSKNQIWWSIFCVGHKGSATGYPQAASVVAVFDYVAKAWAFHYASGREADTPVSIMYSGITFVHLSQEQIVTSANWNSDEGDFLFRYGATQDGRASDLDNVHTYYVSGRLFKANGSVATFRPVRLKMLSTGKTATNLLWFTEGEEAHGDRQYVDVAGEVQTTTSADRQEASVTIEPHPEAGGTAFWGTGTWNGGTTEQQKLNFKYEDRDWFTHKIENPSIRSRSLRFGFADRGTSPSGLVVQAIGVEVEGGDAR